MTSEAIGTVQAIYRYPVKSMQGESLGSAALRWSGIDGDRQYAFYRATNRSRFPWLTGREVPALVTHRARYMTPENPRSSAVRVACGDDDHDVNDAALRDRLSHAAGEEIRLLQVGRGTFDALPVSVLSSATLALIEARCEHPVDLRRFRANIVIASGQRETDWIGATLIFGKGAVSAKLRANCAIDRCVMITIDPNTGSRDPAILRRVVDDFNNAVGARCATDALGTIATGDTVRLVRAGARAARGRGRRV